MDIERMEDLPMKSQPTPHTRASTRKNPRISSKQQRNPDAIKAARARYKATMRQERINARSKKSLPPVRLPGEEQPRDSLGRFARKTGAVLWGAAKGAGRAVVGTAKGIKKAHKTVKRVRAAGRRRANLEARERRIALAERERKAGMKRKKVRRRRR